MCQCVRRYYSTLFGCCQAKTLLPGGFLFSFNRLAAVRLARVVDQASGSLDNLAASGGNGLVLLGHLSVLLVRIKAQIVHRSTKWFGFALISEQIN